MYFRIFKALNVLLWLISCNGSYHRLAPSFFEEMIWYCRLWKDNPNGPSKFRKNITCTFRFYVCLRLRDRDCCSAADGSDSYQAPASSYFEEVIHRRRQKLHWRWPGNRNGRSKFCNLDLFTFTRSQLTLRRRLRGWWRLPDIAQTARNQRQQHCRDDQDRSKFMPMRSSKTSWKTSFCCYERCRDWWHCAILFPAITGNSFCFHIRKIISRRSWSHRKTEIYIL